MKIAIVAGGAKSLAGFRLPLIKHWLALGHEIVAVACERNDTVFAALAALGVRFEPIATKRTGVNPFSDLVFLARLAALLRRERADLAFLFQQKPVLYGAFAAKLAGTPHIFPLITGLGYAFMPRPGLKYKIVHAVACALYRVAAYCFDGVLFQNPDDLAYIKSNFLDRAHVPVRRVYGSGVELFEECPFSDVSHDADAGTFLFVGRLLFDKGIREYAEAGEILAAKRFDKKIELRIAGGLDVNPSAITRAQLDAWTSAGAVRWLGKVSEMLPVLRAASVFVLPSYREGTPRSGIEAMAVGRPIIVANTPGCREVVFFEKTCRVLDAATGTLGEALRLPSDPREHLGEILCGDNGFLVPERNAQALAAAMEFYLKNPDAVAAHGRESRRLAEKYYDVRDVNRQVSEFVGAEPYRI